MIAATSAGPSTEACRNAAAILMHALERIAREDAETAYQAAAA